jgi:hypothetical protein
MIMTKEERGKMLTRTNALALATSLFAAMAIPNPVSGAECQGAKFPDSVTAGSSNLLLNGLGIRKATLLKVKVYVAGLYLPAKSGDSAQILGASQPWHLVLHFLRDVGASDIREAYDDGFKKAAGDKLAALQQRIDNLNARIVDFKEGQELSFTNDPAKGIAMDVNGKAGDPIEGADFAEALLKISIGPEPPNEDLKSGLLGGKCE